MKKDSIYKDSNAGPEEFRFDEQVAKVFDDMIQRSVPGYEMMLEMIGLITRRYARPDSNCYDLGCSLGASTRAIIRNLPDNSCTVIAVDSSRAMLDRCYKSMEPDREAGGKLKLRCEDISDTEFENASIVVMNLTLQFIRPGKRLDLLKRIHEGLEPEGVFVLSEKIIHEDEAENGLLMKLHHDYKRYRGYSNLEIARKRDAIENVLIPETIAAHITRLKDAGFTGITQWFQCFNFISLLAMK